MKVKVRADRDGVLSQLDEVPVCAGCGCEVEVAEYFVRRFRRASDGAEVKVRVGYRCGCGTIAVDGLYQGHRTS